MTALLAASGGFLLAVLWMDLMFDVQARRLSGPPDDRERALASIAAYYRRVTTDASPMNRLIASVMLVQICGVVAQALRRVEVSGWRALAVLVLGVAPVALALGRIVPDAVRLGSRRDDVGTQVTLAWRIYRGHVACFVAIAAFVLLELRLR